MKPGRSRYIMTMAFAALAASALCQSNIDSAAPYAWGENVGWVNFRGDGANGVVVAATYLRGFAWSENVGWINLGAGPANAITYTQGAGDTGVNKDPSGNLSGFAWGENIGWIAFDTSGSGGSQVTIDAFGQFHGFAWSENVGWIAMDSGFGVMRQGDPLLVTVASFTATTTPSGVRLDWLTTAETNNAGFNLYRLEPAVTKLNASLIPAQGLDGAGASYRFLDAGITGGTYYLEDVDFNGTKTLHGPVTASSTTTIGDWTVY